MRKLMLFICFVCAIFVANSQNLKVEGTAPDLYITHIVAPKENFYSVGRLYNQAPKAIAAINKTTLEKGLTIGQHIKIPVNAQNFDGSGNAASGESLIPLTHIVAKNENLFKIGSKFNVPAASIRQWNSLSSDNIAPASPLIVGYLKMQPGAATAKVSNSAPVQKAEPATRKEAGDGPKQEVAEKKEAVEKKEAEAPGKKEVAEKKEAPEKKETAEKKEPVEKKDVGDTSKEGPFVSVAAGKKENADEPKKSEGAGKSSTKEERIEVVEPAAAPAKTEEPKRANKAESSKTDVASMGAGNSTEGVFAVNYSEETSQKTVSNKSGDAATFKSTSGWQDKKYYVLMNDVTPGTILKITAADNKVVYAKVLGSMPEMKENNGLLLRISNAAASYLGIIDPKFPVQVSYYQ